jgi:hypothetical protein
MKKVPIVSAAKKRVDNLKSRRPHRSFVRTKRRDYARTLDLPGYISFTNYVGKTIWSSRKMFFVFGLVYSLVTIILVGMASQDAFSTLVNTLNTTSSDLFNGFWGEIGGAGLLFLSAVTGGSLQTLSEVQQLYAVLLTLFGWLTVVWLLRNVMAGHKVKVRDGIYNAGAPIVPTMIILLLGLFQLLPLALALIGYSAASSTGLLNSGVEAMLFWVFAALMTGLSLYWITSTFFAMVIATLPGMYPYRAIKIAGDLVIGRRLRILYRILWMALILVIAWGVVMIPLILFDGWVKGLWPAVEWMPFVPIALLILNTLTIIWVSGYVYLLYRKVVDSDDAKA